MKNRIVGVPNPLWQAFRTSEEANTWFRRHHHLRAPPGSQIPAASGSSLADHAGDGDFTMVEA